MSIEGQGHFKISGERLQDHWSSGFNQLHVCSSFGLIPSIQKGRYTKQCNLPSTIVVGLPKNSVLGVNWQFLKYLEYVEGSQPTDT